MFWCYLLMDKFMAKNSWTVSVVCSHNRPYIFICFVWFPTFSLCLTFGRIFLASSDCFAEKQLCEIKLHIAYNSKCRWLWAVIYKTEMNMVANNGMCQTKCGNQCSLKTCLLFLCNKSLNCSVLIRPIVK